MPRTGVCRLCRQRTEIHPEHALPVWLIDLLDMRTAWGTRDGAERMIEREWKVDVCLPCNAAMNVRYEDTRERRDKLVPMIGGTPVWLTRREQRWVAAWLAKTALMIDASQGAASPSLLHTFWANGFTLPGAIVWIASISTPIPPAVKQPPDPGIPQQPGPDLPPAHGPLADLLISSVHKTPDLHVSSAIFGDLAACSVHLSPPQLIPWPFQQTMDQWTLRLPARTGVEWPGVWGLTNERWDALRRRLVVYDPQDPPTE